MTFQKGKSGNPGGKVQDRMPDGRSLRQACRDMVPATLDVLKEIIENVNERGSTRVSAAQIVLERAFGRPEQAVTLSGPDGGPIQMLGMAAQLSPVALRELAQALEQEDLDEQRTIEHVPRETE